MCGITGLVNLQGYNISPSLLKAMTRAIEHRGPDGSGEECFVDDGVFLGHTRLSIQDLSSAGAQPMKSRDEKLVITFNGEIYNFSKINYDSIHVENLVSLFFKIKNTN